MGALVVSNGTIRFPHIGHLKMIRDLWEIAHKDYNYGIVYFFLDTKKRVQEIKPGVFCMEDKDRWEFLQYCTDIDGVDFFSSTEELKEKVLKVWQENKKWYNKLIYCKGGDYENKDLDMKEFIENLGGEVRLTTYYPEWSSSKLIADLQGQK